MNKYRTSLECGDVDPDEVIPQFLEELEDAGINKIIEEKQNQLNAWVGQE